MKKNNRTRSFSVMILLILVIAAFPGIGKGALFPGNEAVFARETGSTDGSGSSDAGDSSVGSDGNEGAGRGEAGDDSTKEADTEDGDKKEDNTGADGSREITLTGNTGSARALVVRVGFSDHPLSEETGETNITAREARDHFECADLSEYPYENVGAYYSRSSYDRFKLSLGEIIDVQLPEPVSTYSGKTGGENEYRLINDIISHSELKEKLPEYDADGDGTADFVYFLCNGKNEDKGNIWWPHCHLEGDETFTSEGIALGDYVLSCKTETRVLIHETGHLLGMTDLYDYTDYPAYNFNVPDMMSDNTGDHNGFFKMLAGWIDDREVEYVNADGMGDDGVKVSFNPVDTASSSGTRIAIISPEYKGLYSEFYVAEYVSGTGNMSMFDGRRDYPAGFRIYHVYFDPQEDRFLAHAVTKDHATGADFGVFGEGDEISHYTDPSTDFLSDGEMNVFTGICIYDLVTGDSPSLKIRFADEDEIDDRVVFTPEDTSVSNMLEITLDSDRPLTLKKTGYGAGYARLEKDGEIYPVVLKADPYNATKFHIEYRDLKNPLLPDTGYRLVIPRGTFADEDGKAVAETRIDIRTGKFTRLENVTSMDIGDSGGSSFMRTDLVSLGDGSGYIASSGKVTDEGTGFIFRSYDPGNALSQKEFFVDLPEGSGKITAIDVIVSHKGGYIFYLKTEKNTFVQRLSENGETASGLAVIPEQVDIIELGDGLKGLSTSTKAAQGLPVISQKGEFTGAIWSFDLENEPTRVLYRYDAYLSGGFFALDDDRYCISGFDTESGSYYTDIYDKTDKFLKRIYLSENLPLSFCVKNGKITVAEIAFDEETGEEHFVILSCDPKDGSIIKKRVEGHNLDEMYFAGIKLMPADFGYVLFYRYSGKTDQPLSKLMFLNDGFEPIGSVTLPGGADCIPQKDRVVVVWEDVEGRSMAWTEVLVGDSGNGGKDNDEKETSSPRDPGKESQISGDDPGDGTPSDSQIHTSASGSGTSHASDTGDRDSIWIWWLVGGCAAAGIAVTVMIIRKRDIS